MWATAGLVGFFLRTLTFFFAPTPCLSRVRLFYLGRARWFMVHPRHVPDLEKALIELLKKMDLNKHMNGVPEEADWRQLMLLLFHGKRLFPSPEELRQVGFNHIIEMDVCGGDFLYADGTCAHWGMNQADSSVSLAINVVPESWLQVHNCQQQRQPVECCAC